MSFLPDQRTVPSRQRQDSRAGPQWHLEDLVNPSLYYEQPSNLTGTNQAAPTSGLQTQYRTGPLQGYNQPQPTPRYALYQPPASQLSIDPKLIDPGLLSGEREWPEEEQKPASSPARKRRTPARKTPGADTESPKKKARSTPTKPRVSTSKATVGGGASPQKKKGRK